MMSGIPPAMTDIERWTRAYRLLDRLGLIRHPAVPSPTHQVGGGCVDQGPSPRVSIYLPPPPKPQPNSKGTMR